MIKNERQYRITKSQVERFSKALQEFEKQERPNIHPLLLKAEKDALESQLTDLQRQVKEYEELTTGIPPLIELRSIEDIPNTLIRARIALGLSQRDLAERINVPEQVIQRYESNDYESASVARIKEIADALNISVAENINFHHKISLKEFFNRMSEAGLEREFIMQNILPPMLAARFDDSEIAPDLLAYQAAAHVGRIFGWKPDEILGTSPLPIDTTPIIGVKFKVPKRPSESKLRAYTVYAHYLALILAQAASHITAKELPTDPHVVRNEIISRYGSITLQSLLRYIWDHGVPVLAVNPNSFHAACFRSNDRSVIVLAQKTTSSAKWKFNLLHEYWHAAQCKEQIAESEDVLRDSDEERVASQFADIVLLGKDAHKLAEKCIDEARGSIPQLKRAVQVVARKEGISADVLANYLAYRLSAEQGINWWSTAESLQEAEEKPRTIIRNILLEYANLSVLSEPDLELLRHSIEDVPRHE